MNLKLTRTPLKADIQTTLSYKARREGGLV
jgi:hypothetical protein